MQPKFEVHNLDENVVPRRYEAVYVFAEKLLVRIVIGQRQDRVGARGAKPVMRWLAVAYAWTPGTGDEQDTILCSLNRSEITAREVLPHEATPEMWLEAVHFDAGVLIERAQVFADVLIAGTQEGRGKKRLAA